MIYPTQNIHPHFFSCTNLSAADSVCEEPDLLLVKKFSLVTTRTLPPSSLALLREASATSSLLRYLEAVGLQSLSNWGWGMLGDDIGDAVTVR